MTKIQELMPKILGAKEDGEIKWLSKRNNLVFKLAEDPEVVFKIPRPNHFYGEGKLPTYDNEQTNNRFANMLKAKKVCVVNELGLLIIPHAKKFDITADGNQYAIIAEQSLDLASNESAQAELYHTYSKEINGTARQTAIFIAKTGFNDVTWRNIPLLNEKPTYQGPRRVALIDLEHMESIVNGFMGDDNGSCGLIKCCASEEQIDLVIEEIHQQGIVISLELLQDAKNQRLKELASDKQLQQFYEDKKIVTGKELIQVDLNTLDLDLTETVHIRLPVEEGQTIQWQDQTLTLKKVVEDVIEEINKLIKNSSDQASLKGKRYFVLHTNEEPFMYYQDLGVPPERLFINKEEEKNFWLPRIIQELIDKEYLFKLDKVNGHGYFIQA